MNDTMPVALRGVVVPGGLARTTYMGSTRSRYRSTKMQIYVSIYCRLTRDKTAATVYTTYQV